MTDVTEMQQLSLIMERVSSEQVLVDMTTQSLCSPQQSSLSTIERDMVQSGYVRQFKLDTEFPNVLLSVIDAYNPKSIWIGNDALNFKNKRNPIEHQIVTNWDIS